MINTGKVNEDRDYFNNLYLTLNYEYEKAGTWRKGAKHRLRPARFKHVQKLERYLRISLSGTANE